MRGATATRQCSGNGQRPFAGSNPAAPSTDKARYGAVKLWRALQLAGVRCGRHRVARLRRQHGLLAQRIRRFRVMHERHECAPPAPNRLQQVFVAPAVNRIWGGDLTAIATRAGWLYLAVVLDLYSRRVIGWAMSAKPDQHAGSGAAHGHGAPPSAARLDTFTPIRGRFIPVWPTSACWLSVA